MAGVQIDYRIRTGRLDSEWRLYFFSLNMSVPSEKAKRYDRQLRLWGDHGQGCLEDAHICLINASATGTEILKNLVLPGIGAFTIVDSNKVRESDLGSNFFVTANAVGKFRAEVAVELLVELNTEVRGNFIEDSVESLLDSNPNFFDTFTLVVATDIPESTLLKLSQALWKASTLLLVAWSYGLLGYIRISFPQHEVIEAHPDNSHNDLRLDCPFPSLVTYMDQIDLDNCDNTAHGNVPYLAVLYKYIKKWKDAHNGEMPRTYKEKKELKSVIEDGIRKNEDGVPLDEDNFQEAMTNLNGIIVPTQISSVVQQIFDNPCCDHISPDSSDFWLLARAVREFVTNDGCGRLPLRGSIPDMTSSSDLYISLQRAYQSKAREDLESVSDHLGQLLVSLNKPSNSIPENTIKLFCRNAAFIRVLRYRSIETELHSPNVDELRRNLDNPDSDIVYYVLLRAAAQYYSIFKYYPGGKRGPIEADVLQMKTSVANLLQQWGLPMYSVRDDHITEFCRYGGGEIHSIAAYIGGVAAQEVIKIITKQYVPLNNTYIYNAASCTSMTVEL